MINVLLADDHQLVRDGLKQLLSAAAGIEVAAEASTGDEALALVKQSDFDLVLLDMSMPGLSGINLIKRLKLERPKLRVLVLSMHGERQYAARALKAGASGYLTKDSATAELVSAIRKIAAGGVYLTDAAATSLVESRASSDQLPHEQLSDREFEIFRLLCTGVGPTEIADQLHLSVKTVSTHKTRILEKMNLDNSAELVRYALQHDLLDSRPDS
jgi:two-component system, NarL family, invasion response regulator UvrY